MTTILRTSTPPRTTNINVEHYRNVDLTIQRERGDIEVLELGEFLPG